VPDHTMTGFRSRRATTARPSLATPGSIPSTQVSNNCSCSLSVPGRAGNHRGNESYSEAMSSSEMSKFA
jgi:hypothetical protein